MHQLDEEHLENGWGLFVYLFVCLFVYQFDFKYNYNIKFSVMSFQLH